MIQTRSYKTKSDKIISRKPSQRTTHDNAKNQSNTQTKKFQSGPYQESCMIQTRSYKIKSDKIISRKPSQRTTLDNAKNQLNTQDKINKEISIETLSGIMHDTNKILQNKIRQDNLKKALPKNHA